MIISADSLLPKLNAQNASGQPASTGLLSYMISVPFVPLALLPALVQKYPDQDVWLILAGSTGAAIGIRSLRPGPPFPGWLRWLEGCLAAPFYLFAAGVTGAYLSDLVQSHFLSGMAAWIFPLWLLAFALYPARGPLWLLAGVANLAFIGFAVSLAPLLPVALDKVDMYRLFPFYGWTENSMLATLTLTGIWLEPHLAVCREKRDGRFAAVISITAAAGTTALLFALSQGALGRVQILYYRYPLYAWVQTLESGFLDHLDVVVILWCCLTGYVRMGAFLRATVTSAPLRRTPGLSLAGAAATVFLLAAFLLQRQQFLQWVPYGYMAAAAMASVLGASFLAWRLLRPRTLRPPA